MIISSFIFFLGLFLAIGIWASTKHINTTEDYLLAGRNVNPWLAGLSACATEKSGFTFIGYVGMVYMVGLSGVWLFLGMYSAYLLFLPKIASRTKEISAEHNLQTYNQLLGTYKSSQYKKLAFITGVLIIVFLGLYAAAQLTAGSKALTVLFNWPEYSGAVLGAVILLLYSYSGGIRASIWTDAAQMAAMVLSMGLLLWGAINISGGLSDFWSQLQNIGNGYTAFVPGAIQPILLLWLGWFFGGLGISGQPHIMIRFMAVSDPADAKKAHYVFLGSNMLFVLLTTLTAMAARLLIDHNGDPELTLPLMSMEFLPPVLTGLMLAGLFASTMSTADSQVLSCSAALSQDILPLRLRGKYQSAKYSTLAVILIILLIALFGSQSVFTLVIAAWGGLAAAFGPLALLKLSGQNFQENESIAIVLTGLIAALAWRFTGMSALIFEAAPGVLAGFMCYILIVIKQRIRT